MPQTLSPDWEQMLGDGWEQIHSDWLHRLGNLTLTAYNSEYSNRRFGEKKTIEGGFNNSPLRLNSYIKLQQVWTPDQMEERGRQLAEEALDIWPYPTADDEFVRESDINALRKREARIGFESLKLTERCSVLLYALDREFGRWMKELSVQLREFRLLLQP